MKKLSIFKKIVLVLIFILLILQFIRPGKNEGKVYGSNDVTHSVEVPEDVKTILGTSCFDCHSNFTNHMWYENIQPFGWWISNHINEGKEELNFSEFNTYTDKRKAHKFEEIVEMVEEGEMPLSSYTLIHGNAKLSPEQKEKIITWAKSGQKKFELPE